MMVYDEVKPRMPRWPKPHLKKLGPHSNFSPWVVIFTNPRYPHTRYSTGHHATTFQEAWAHLPTMQDWHGVPR